MTLSQFNQFNVVCNAWFMDIHTAFVPVLRDDCSSTNLKSKLGNETPESCPAAKDAAKEI